MQKIGGNAMLVDAEHAFDPSYSKALGVDVENLIVCQPDNGEMALESKDVFLHCSNVVVTWIFEKKSLVQNTNPISKNFCYIY